MKRMIPSIFARLTILIVGYLYPAYYSHKAIATKDNREYVRWMMYWVIFSSFTVAESFIDVFLSFWFPFYDEIKICFILWLSSSSLRGASFLYRRALYPFLTHRSQEIDDRLKEMQERGYTIILTWGKNAVLMCSCALRSLLSKAYISVLPGAPPLNAEAFGFDGHGSFPVGPAARVRRPIAIDFYAENPSRYATLPRGFRLRGYDVPDGLEHVEAEDGLMLGRGVVCASAPVSPDGPLQRARISEVFGDEEEEPPRPGRRRRRATEEEEEEDADAAFVLPSSSGSDEEEDPDYEPPRPRRLPPLRQPAAPKRKMVTRLQGSGVGDGSAPRRAESMSSLIPNRRERAATTTTTTTIKGKPRRGRAK